MRRNTMWQRESYKWLGNSPPFKRVRPSDKKKLNDKNPSSAKDYDYPPGKTAEPMGLMSGVNINSYKYKNITMCNNACIHHVPDFSLRAFFDNSF
jgi:hypothetical protein